MGTLTLIDPEKRPARPPLVGRSITEAYARLVARDTYFWAWTMAAVFSRRIGCRALKQPGRLGGVIPAAPPNHLCMLTDYVAPSMHEVACPNRDTVYGAGSLALDVEPAVVQVPDFGDRFWIYQVVDLRSDSFARLGKMYNSEPGFYLLVGPDWKGEAPQPMRQVFRSKTSTGFICPRVFMNDTDEDRRAIQPLINQIDVYPVTHFNGTMKRRDWSRVANLPPASSSNGNGLPNVRPDNFFDVLPRLLKDAPPLPGEEVRYSEALVLLDAARRNPRLRAVIIEEALRAQEELVEPLLEFRSFGIPLAHHWTTSLDGAPCGTDYFTRNAMTRSNLFINRPTEAKYFYQDLDEAGGHLNGSRRYRVTFPKDQPPVHGFWSLTLYDSQYSLVPNDINRFSVGTKSHDLTRHADGSVTVLIQAEPPTDPAWSSNWLPAPRDEDFSLLIRAYWPTRAVVSGRWAPPPVERQP
jgi:hypothetical protein